MIVEAGKNPELLLQASSQIIGNVVDNANAYNTSRVIGRSVTGFVLAPLRALAGAGDLAYGMEQKYTTMSEHLKSIFYGH